MSVPSSPETPLKDLVFRPSGLDIVPIVETTDAKDGIDTIYTLKPGEAFEGEILGPDDDDWVRLDVGSSGSFVLSLFTRDVLGYFTNDPVTGVVYNEYDSAGSLIPGPFRVIDDAAVPFAQGQAPAYVSLSSFLGGNYQSGFYQVRLEALDEPVDLPGDRTSTATISPGQSFTGLFNFGANQDLDAIAVFLEEGETYQFFLMGRDSFEGTAGRFGLRLEGENGEFIQSGVNYDSLPFDNHNSNEQTLSYTAEDTGVYYLFASGSSYFSNNYPQTYRLFMEQKPPIVVPPINKVGTLGSDFLLGQDASDDTLIGLAGNDFLDGRAGADRMEGGPGDDSYAVDDAGDDVVEKVGEGRDTVSTTLAAYALLPNFEDLAYDGSGDFTGTGNGLANTITGAAGTDTLKGAGGKDDLLGLGGNDKLVGGKGNDALNGGAGNDLASGGAGNDLINGGEDDDTLRGGGGNDRLEGGKGADRMIGGGGNDIYIVESDADVIKENRGKGVDTVETGLTSFTLAAHFENLTFTGAGDFTGNGNALANAMTGGAGDDVLTGFSGKDVLTGNNGNDKLLGGEQADTLDGGKGNDVLNGGAGADHMSGGAGNDAYFVDSRRDTVTERANEGRDTVNTELASYKLGANIENLVYLGDEDFDGRGNALSNQISGRSGKDTLYGFAGNDRLDGGAGRDILFGGTGNDIMDGGFGRDLFHFSTGKDSITDFEFDFDQIDLSAAKGIGSFKDLVNNHMRVVGEPVVEVPNTQSNIRITGETGSAERPVAQENETFTFVLSRRDDTRKETAYVSTSEDFGYDNNGDFDPLDAVEIVFQPGESTKTVDLKVNDDGEREGEEKFSVFVHFVQNDITSYVDSATFVIEGDTGYRGVSGTSGTEARNGVIIADARGNELYIENVTLDVLTEDVFVF